MKKPPQPMRAAGREPTGGEIPVELVRCQPLDDFPQQSGVSRTNGIALIYGQAQDGSVKTEIVLELPGLHSVLLLGPT